MSSWTNDTHGTTESNSNTYTCDLIAPKAAADKTNNFVLVLSVQPCVILKKWNKDMQNQDAKDSSEPS